jgi:hypothetical protein
MNQENRPLAPTRGQLMDHIALSVTNLDAWVAKLSGEGVKILERPYKLRESRAALIEGPSREAIELVEKKIGGCLWEPHAGGEGHSVSGSADRERPPGTGDRPPIPDGPLD